MNALSFAWRVILGSIALALLAIAFGREFFRETNGDDDGEIIDVQVTVKEASQ